MMSIYGYSKVEVENMDSDLCWNVYKPKTNQIIVKLSYRYIFEIKEICHNEDLLNALSACLCFLGMPNDEVIEHLFVMYPDIRRTPHVFCIRAMKNSEWATKKSKVYAKPLASKKKLPAKNKTEKSKKQDDDDGDILVFEAPDIGIGRKKRKLNL